MKWLIPPLVCAAFGLWLGLSLSDAIESVSKERAAERQRCDLLEKRVEALEKPLPVYPRAPEGQA